MSVTHAYSQVLASDKNASYTSAATSFTQTSQRNGNGNTNGNHASSSSSSSPSSSVSIDMQRLVSTLQQDPSDDRDHLLDNYDDYNNSRTSSNKPLREPNLPDELRELMSEEDLRAFARRHDIMLDQEEEEEEERRNGSGNGASAASSSSKSASSKKRAAYHLRPRSPGLVRLYSLINRCLDVVPACLDSCMRLLGPFLIIVAWLLFATCALVFFGAIVPTWEWDVMTFPGCFIIPYGLFLLFHVYYNHIFSVFIRPGTTPVEWEVPPNIHDLIEEESLTIVRGETSSKWCKTCLREKAKRMHHCHVCGKCVQRMDHHCPWIGGCVGYRNYRYFYNFLFWLEIGCIYLIFCTFPLVVMPTDEQRERMYAKHIENRVFFQYEGSVFFILVLTSAASLAVGGLLLLHTYLVLTNQTTIEMYQNGKKKKIAKRRMLGESGGNTSGGGANKSGEWLNPYDLGSFRANWFAALGSHRSQFFLLSLFPEPLGFAKLDGDGIKYEQNPKLGKEYYKDTRREENAALVV